MKLRSILFIAAIAAGLQAGAQVWVSDSVQMGAPAGAPPISYPTDIYYSLHNGKISQDSNFRWHLGFEMLPAVGPGSGVGIFANHVQGKVSVFSVHKQASTNFTGYSASDTAGALSTPLYNSDSNWNYGAFNRMNNASQIYDFSWGIYDPGTHDVIGDSLYVIKIAGDAYKVWIEKYHSTPSDSIYYLFHVATLNNSVNNTVKIYRAKTPDFKERVLAYYNVITNQVIDREPSRFNWDILFTRYMEYVTVPFPAYYPVTGVLSNYGVKVADVRNVDPDTAHRENYTMTSKMNEIGSDWKTFNMTTFQYDLDTHATFFIKSVNTQEYFQIKFTGFTSSLGKIVFAKRSVGTTKVADVKNNVSAYSVMPNPAVNEADLMVDVKSAAKNARLVVTDITGKIMLNSIVDLKEGMNAFRIRTAEFASGTYLLSVTDGNWKISDKLTVQH